MSKDDLKLAIHPGQLWRDTNGFVINAHGGGIMLHDGVYWWYGEHKIYGQAGNSAHVGVHVYSSTDLVNWDDRGVALAVDTQPTPEHCSADLGDVPRGSDITDGCVLERPKVIFCKKTGKFVMFFHLEIYGRGYDEARTGIAVADMPEGPFKFIRSLRPNGAMARDMTLFVDDDGKAYHIFASENNCTTHIDALTDDFLDYTGTSWRMGVDDSTEAAAICKHNGWYFLIGSGCTGWNPNTARMYRSKNLAGPWERIGNPCRGVNHANGLGPEKTWGAQSTFMLPLPDGSVVAMFDIWRPANHLDSRYVWLPVVFDDDADSLHIDWLDEWEL